MANSTVSANVAISALCTAAASRTISSVKYWVDSGQITDMSGPSGSTSATWTATWSSTGVADGTHTVYVRQYDSSGSSTQSSVRVTVNNSSISISVPTAATLGSAIDTTVTTDVAITVKSPSLAWGLTVVKNHDLQSGSLIIPSSRFTFTSSTTGTGAVATIPTQIPTAPPAPVVNAAAPTSASGVTVTIHYAVLQTYNDAPAAYSATHTFVVTTQ